MISEVFKTIRGIRPFFLLVIFFTLSMAVYDEGIALLTEPVTPWALLIPVMAMLSYGLAWAWVFLIIRASVLLPKEDLGNFGYLIACSVMVFALLVTFSYIGNYHGDIGLSTLSKPGFIYTCTLYLMALVAFDVSAS